MEIYIDDVAHEVEAQTLGEVIDAVRDRLEPTGRLIVEVQLEGATLEPDAISSAQHQPVVGEVRLVTADPHELVLQALESVRLQMDDAQAIQQRAAELLQQDQQAEAMAQVGRMMEIWQGTQQVVVQTAGLIGIDLAGIEIEGVSLEAAVQELLDRFKDLRELVINKDMVGLADALAYEWPRITTFWQAVVDQMIANVEQQAE